MKQRLFSFSFLILVLTGCVSNQNINQHWVGITRKDLKAIQHNILVHSAPAANLEDKVFHNWLEKGFQQAQLFALRVRNETDYREVLQFFVNGFKSDHLSVRFSDCDTDKEWYFPGFLLKKINQKYVVGYKDKDDSEAISIGTQVIEIDNILMNSYMKENIISLYGVQWEQAEYISLAPSILIDRGHFLIKRPQRITILNTEGKEEVYALKWKPKKVSEVQKIVQALSFPKKPPMEINEMENGGVWITLPTFNPNENQQQKFLKLFNDLKEYRKRSFIVFDLRGNGGGSSNWERPILRNLYGDLFLKALGAKHSYNQTWIKKIRVSRDNYESLKVNLSPHENRMFQEDLKMHHTFYTETWNIFDENVNLFHHQDEKSLAFPKVYLLTDDRCGSTCWLFVREMLKMPNVIQIGAETRSQSLYSEARWIELPSGLAKVYIPMQQRVMPIDHIGRPFVPSICYTGNWNNEEKVRQWTLQIVEKHKFK